MHNLCQYLGDGNFSLIMSGTLSAAGPEERVWTTKLSLAHVINLSGGGECSP
jgi:hypothetical protein